jgi:putative ATPase
VISALLSRCQVYTLKPFSKEELIALLKRAMNEDPVIKSRKVQLQETEAILRLSGGDARKLLNIFELLVTSSQAPVIDHQ